MNQLSFAVSLQKTSFGAIAFGESFAGLVKELKKLGYHGVELAIRNPEEINQEEVIRTVQEANLTVPAIGTGQAFLEEGLSLSHTDDAVRRKTIERLKAHILLASSLGALVIVGLIRGNLPAGTNEREEVLVYFKEALAECSRFAEENGVKLVIEPLNRYEVNFLHTIDETVALIKSLKRPNIGILADSFHMNIEEVDFYQSLCRAQNLLWHFHIADSNRLAPGWGHTDFTPFAQALRDIHYQGFISAEILPKPNFQEAARQTVTYFARFIQGV